MRATSYKRANDITNRARRNDVISALMAKHYQELKPLIASADGEDIFTLTYMQMTVIDYQTIDDDHFLKEFRQLYNNLLSEFQKKDSVDKQNEIRCQL